MGKRQCSEHMWQMVVISLGVWEGADLVQNFLHDRYVLYIIFRSFTVTLPSHTVYIRLHTDPFLVDNRNVGYGRCVR